MMGEVDHVFGCAYKVGETRGTAMSEAMTPEELARQALSPWGVTYPEYDNLFDAIVLACNVARNAALEEAAKVAEESQAQYERWSASAGGMYGAHKNTAEGIARAIRRLTTNEGE